MIESEEITSASLPPPLQPRDGAPGVQPATFQGDLPMNAFHLTRTASPESMKWTPSIYRLSSPSDSAASLPAIPNEPALIPTQHWVIPGLPAPETVEPPVGEIGTPATNASQNLDQNTSLWEEYNTMADKEDKESVKAANENLNTLLIFAALFAAINASFIVETFKNLKPDPVDKTNVLLEAMLSLSNSTSSQIPPTFSTTLRDVRTNFVFFFSLCASLAGSFLAVMGKQWVSHYEIEGSFKPPAERARERQMKFEGRKQYHLQGVMESMSTILQVSLIAFLGGLADLLWPLSRLVACCVLAFAGMTCLAWISLTFVAASITKFPYQTRLSLILSRLILPTNKLGPIPEADQSLAVNIRAMIQMLEHITLTSGNRPSHMGSM